MPVKRSAASSSSEPKRTRFASPPPSTSSKGTTSKNHDQIQTEQDDLLEADLPERGQLARRKAKRGIQDVGGYNSDSSGDEESVVPSRSKPVVSDPSVGEDDDVDMFGDDVAPSSVPSGGGTGGKGKEKEKGGKEFMDIKDIEGQENLEEDLSGSSSEEDLEDEGDTNEANKERLKRKKGKEKDLGFEITPFNMKSEMEGGRFTADGETYVENDKDEGEKHDVWLDDIDKSIMRKARKAHKEREKLEKEREERESGLAGAEERRIREEKLMREAVDIMERGETILEALQRLGREAEEKRKKEEMGEGGGGKKKSWIERQRERKAALAKDQEVIDPTHTSSPFTNLSNIVSGLNAIGHLDVHSLSRESLQRMLPVLPPPTNTNGANSNRTNGGPKVSDTRQFQYRFSMTYVRNLPESQRPVEREIFGPFPLSQLQGWRGTGFFGGPNAENVELRAVTPGPEGEQSNWGSWNEVVGS